jgi:hypothetical protein
MPCWAPPWAGCALAACQAARLGRASAAAALRRCGTAQPLRPLPAAAQRRYHMHTLKDEDLPQFRLFLRGANPRKPLEYSGRMTKEDFSAWLVAQTSIFLGKRVGRAGRRARARRRGRWRPRDQLRTPGKEAAAVYVRLSALDRDAACACTSRLSLPLAPPARPPGRARPALPTRPRRPRRWRARAPRAQGQLEGLDAIAKKLVTMEEPRVRAALLAKARNDTAAAAPSLPPRHREYAAYYLKVMERVVERGEQYAWQASARQRGAARGSAGRRGTAQRGCGGSMPACPPPAGPGLFP